MWQSEMMQRAKRRWGIGRRRNAGVDSPGHNLTCLEVDLCSQAESLRKRTNSICSCVLSETPQSLGLKEVLSAYCLELSLCDYLDWNSKLRLRVLSRGLHLRWSVLTFLQPSLLVLGKPEELGEFGCSFPHKSGPCTSWRPHFTRVLLTISHNNQGGMKLTSNCHSL